MGKNGKNGHVTVETIDTVYERVASGRASYEDAEKFMAAGYSLEIFKTAVDAGVNAISNERELLVYEILETRLNEMEDADKTRKEKIAASAGWRALCRSGSN